ncbi:hypothetical protein LX82_03390 [Celeribacter halophilus]|uniref:Uncharacterized protein n=1 Tax=Celeribacter halophilus TaxID=576117 RepID=A0A1I3WLW0_9RHOB|nr:hypothetical protein LX82_03390 [Celeribacter halophilus]SFK07441.1 hypothetical protein SAMN04488138_1269 [Celeribacter halophilus]
MALRCLEEMGHHTAFTAGRTWLPISSITDCAPRYEDRFCLKLLGRVKGQVDGHIYAAKLAKVWGRASGRACRSLQDQV